MILYEIIANLFETIEVSIGKEQVNIFKQLPFDELIDCHFGLGIWIRNNLIHPDRKLQMEFNKQGVFHPDDMSMLIMSEFHKYLNKPF